MLKQYSGMHTEHYYSIFGHIHWAHVLAHGHIQFMCTQNAHVYRFLSATELVVTGDPETLGLKSELIPTLAIYMYVLQ